VAGVLHAFMNARYQDPERRQFISEDPSFLDLSAVSSDLKDPQRLNSYLYAQDNPINKVDTNGRRPEIPLVFGAAFGTAYLQEHANDFYNNYAEGKTGLAIFPTNVPAYLRVGARAGTVAASTIAVAELSAPTAIAATAAKAVAAASAFATNVSVSTG